MPNYYVEARINGSTEVVASSSCHVINLEVASGGCVLVEFNTRIGKLRCGRCLSEPNPKSVVLTVAGVEDTCRDFDHVSNSPIPARRLVDQCASVAVKLQSSK